MAAAMREHTETRYGLAPCTIYRVCVPLTAVTSQLLRVSLHSTRSMAAGMEGLLAADGTICHILAIPSHHGTVPL